jgi:hypothetical protein
MARVMSEYEGVQTTTILILGMGISPCGRRSGELNEVKNKNHD